MVALANMASRGQPAAQPAPDAGMQPQAAPDAAAPEDSSEGDETPNVTPQEQAQYEQFVHNGLETIYSGDNGDKPTARPDILHQLNQSEDVIGNLANTAVRIVTMLQTSAKKAGQTIDDAVLMHGGQAILEELGEVAEAAGIHDYSEKEMQGAWYRALDLWRDTATQAGDVDAEQLKQQFGQIEEADQQGKLNDLLPGIDKTEQPEEKVQ